MPPSFRRIVVKIDLGLIAKCYYREPHQLYLFVFTKFVSVSGGEKRGEATYLRCNMRGHFIVCADNSSNPLSISAMVTRFLLRTLVSLH